MHRLRDISLPLVTHGHSLSHRPIMGHNEMVHTHRTWSPWAMSIMLASTATSDGCNIMYLACLMHGSITQLAFTGQHYPLASQSWRFGDVGLMALSWSHRGCTWTPSDEMQQPQNNQRRHSVTGQIQYNDTEANMPIIKQSLLARWSIG